MYAQITQVFCPSSLFTHLNKSDVTFIPHLLHFLIIFILSIFVLLIAFLHPTFILSLVIVGEAARESIYFAKFSKVFPGIIKRPSNSKYFRKI